MMAQVHHAVGMSCYPVEVRMRGRAREGNGGDACGRTRARGRASEDEGLQARTQVRAKMHAGERLDE